MIRNKLKNLNIQCIYIDKMNGRLRLQAIITRFMKEIFLMSWLIDSLWCIITFRCCKLSKRKGSRILRPVLVIKKIVKKKNIILLRRLSWLDGKIMKLITRLKRKNLTSASFDHYMKLNSGKKNISVKIAILKIEEISREVKKKEMK